MEMMNKNTVKITFYVGKHHTTFKKKMKTHLLNLEKKKINYEIFQRDDKLLPTLCTSTQCVVGIENIVKKIQAIQAE